jgi:hypothetical protein
MKWEQSTIGRRQLLRALIYLAGLVPLASASAPTPANADGESRDEQRKPRYRESEHVKTFYCVNRYPRSGVPC